MITKVRIELEGTRPLLQHNIRLANPLDEVARAMKVVSGKRKKTDEDHAELSRLEFLGSLYHHEKLGPYVKGETLFRCLVEGGKITRSGTQVERALVGVEPEIPLLYTGPRTPEELFADKNFVDMRSVSSNGRPGGPKVTRTRPIFREWRVVAEAELDTKTLNLEQFGEILSDAGSMIGVGDGRRIGFGRFVGTVARV